MFRCLLHLLAVVSCGHVCLSLPINCTAFETSKGTFYAVPDFTAAGCHYSWTNSSKVVLANDVGKANELIIDSNSTSLHTYSCHETIEYSLDCMLEGAKTAVCRANCTGNTRLPRAAENTQWLVPAVCILLLVLVTVGILGLVFRKRLCRWKDGYMKKPENQNPENCNLII